MPVVVPSPLNILLLKMLAPLIFHMRLHTVYYIAEMMKHIGGLLFTVPEADIPTLASMANPLHQRIVFVNPRATIFDSYDEISSYDRDNIESWTSPPPMPFCSSSSYKEQSSKLGPHACS